MELEPRTIEQIGERCEECGATLTPAELKAVLESGGPVLCTVHAAEAEALPDPDEAA
jgi:methionyl-tRNA synthetase